MFASIKYRAITMSGPALPGPPDARARRAVHHAYVRFRGALSGSGAARLGSSRLIQGTEHGNRAAHQTVKTFCHEILAGRRRVGNAQEQMPPRLSADAVFFQGVPVQRDAQARALRHAHPARTVVVEWFVQQLSA